MKEKYASEYPFYDKPGPIAIVHRGGNGAGAEKENSMAAFESANKAGIIYGETDTILSKDGVPLAFHGSRNIQQFKKTGLPLRSELQNMTYSEIKTKIRIGGETIPTLEEVLMTFPEMRFFIDPKTPEVVEPLAMLIKKLKAQERASIGAFSYDRTLRVAEFLGGQKNICTSLDKTGVIMMLGLGLRLTAPLVMPYFNRTGATSLQLPHNIVTEKMIERAHELGINVIVWPNGLEKGDKKNDNIVYMEKVLSQGVYGLMSDHTLELKEAILARDPHNASIRCTR